MKPRSTPKENSLVLVLSQTSVFSANSMVTLTEYHEIRLFSKHPELAHLTSPTSGCRVTFPISLLKAFHYIWHFQSWQDNSEGRAKGCLMMQGLKHSWIFKNKYTKQLPDSERAVSCMGNFCIRPHPDKEILITKFRVCIGRSDNDLGLCFMCF